MSHRLSSLGWDDTTAYVFAGDQYCRLDGPAWTAPSDYPRAVADSWPGLDSAGVDAAIRMPGSDKAYLFKGDQYYRYDVATDKVDDGYPQPIAGAWPGLPEEGISAAVAWPNGKAYFFAGNQYFRYDIANDKVDEGYPQPIRDGWPGLFAADIDAVLLLSDDQALVVSGGLFQLYDIAADRAATEAAPLAQVFPPVWTTGTTPVTPDTTGTATGTFSFTVQSGESINDRVVRCCHEALDAGPMGEKERHDFYKVFISCGQEASDAQAEALTHVRTSCAMFVRAVRHWCGTAPEGPYKPGTGMFVSMGGVSTSHPAWRKNDGTNTPSAGDWFYIQTDGKNNGHTGIFVEDLGDGRWKTAEGGGGDGTLCRFTERTIANRTFTNDPRPLQGWVDCTQVGLPDSP